MEKNASNIQQTHNNFPHITRAVKRVELSISHTVVADMFDTFAC